MEIGINEKMLARIKNIESGKIKKGYEEYDITNGIYIQKQHGPIEKYLNKLEKHEDFNINVENKYKIDIYTKEYCKELSDLKEKRIELIKSNLGTGKTRALIDYIKKYLPKHVILTSSRRLYAVYIYGELMQKINEIVDDIDMYMPFEEKKKLGIFKYIDIILYLIDNNQLKNDEGIKIIQMESLYKLYENTKKIVSPDLFVVDEITSCLSQFASYTMGNNILFNYKIFNCLIKKSKKVVFLDGDIDARFFNMISKVIQKEIVYIQWNLFIRDTIKSINYHCKYNLAEELINDLKLNKKIYVCFSIKSDLDIVKDMIIKELPNKVIYFYNRDNSNDEEIIKQLSNVNKSWLNADIVMTTSTITNGISFDNEYFDLKYLFGNCLGPHVRDLTQMLDRVRHTKENIIKISFEYKNFFIKEEQSDFDKDNPNIIEIETCKILTKFKDIKNKMINIKEDEIEHIKSIIKTYDLPDSLKDNLISKQKNLFNLIHSNSIEYKEKDGYIFEIEKHNWLFNNYIYCIQENNVSKVFFVKKLKEQLLKRGIIVEDYPIKNDLKNKGQIRKELWTDSKKIIKIYNNKKLIEAKNITNDEAQKITNKLKTNNIQNIVTEEQKIEKAKFNINQYFIENLDENSLVALHNNNNEHLIYLCNMRLERDINDTNFQMYKYKCVNKDKNIIQDNITFSRYVIIKNILKLFGIENTYTKNEIKIDPKPIYVAIHEFKLNNKKTEDSWYDLLNNAKKYFNFEGEITTSNFYRLLSNIFKNWSGATFCANKLLPQKRFIYENKKYAYSIYELNINEHSKLLEKMKVYNTFPNEILLNAKKNKVEVNL